jgi:hypothetical protein
MRREIVGLPRCGAGLFRAMRREVGAELDVEITAPTELEFQIAVARRIRILKYRSGYRSSWNENPSSR